MTMDNYPSNSRRIRDEQPKTNPKNVEKVVSGPVLRRKKPLSKRLSETFVGGDAGSVWEYVTRDVLIPAFKDTVTDAITQGVERLIFGEVRGGRRSTGRGFGSGYTNYNSRYSGGGTAPRSSLLANDEPRSRISRETRTAHSFEDIILESRAEAESVLQQMFDILDEYEVVAVRDLYESLGETGSWTDEKWGWTDLRNANVVRVKGGYLLNVPRPEPLK